MTNIQKLAIFNTIALLLHIATSVAVQSRWVNPFTVGEIADRNPTLFTPAGFSFSIWGLIYISLVVFCAFHLFTAFRHSETTSPNKKLRNTYPWFIINNLATVAWLIVWTHERLLLSVLLIIVQLVSLIILHNRLCIHDATTPMRIKVCTQFPISIYFGWITVATVANIAAWLTANQWDRWNISAINWTITMVAVITLIAMWVMNSRLNVIFGLVAGWGLYGILARLTEINKEEFEPIIYTIYGGLVLIGFKVLIALVRNVRKPDARREVHAR